jgi:hypothetical protein
VATSDERPTPEPRRAKPWYERPDGLPPEEERHRDRLLNTKEIRFMRLTAAFALVAFVGMVARGYPGAGLMLLVFVAGWIVTLPKHQRRQLLGQQPPVDEV